MSAGTSGFGSISAIRRSSSRLLRNRAAKDLRVPFAPQVRADHEHARQVDLALCDGVAELGVLAHEMGCFRTPERRVLSHPELVNAVGVERRAGALAVDAAPLHLTEVGKQVGQRDIGARGQPLHRGKQLVGGHGR
jgi:hypothetical protein